MTQIRSAPGEKVKQEEWDKIFKKEEDSKNLKIEKKNRNKTVYSYKKESMND
jgi:hypothetical protein